MEFHHVCLLILILYMAFIIVEVHGKWEPLKRWWIKRNYTLEKYLSELRIVGRVRCPNLKHEIPVVVSNWRMLQTRLPRSEVGVLYDYDPNRPIKWRHVIFANEQFFRTRSVHRILLVWMAVGASLFPNNETLQRNFVNERMKDCHWPL